jgi:hypothetical protein
MLITLENKEMQRHTVVRTPVTGTKYILVNNREIAVT